MICSIKIAYKYTFGIHSTNAQITTDFIQIPVEILIQDIELEYRYEYCNVSFRTLSGKMIISFCFHILQACCSR